MKYLCHMYKKKTFIYILKVDLEYFVIKNEF